MVQGLTECERTVNGERVGPSCDLLTLSLYYIHIMRFFTTPPSIILKYPSSTYPRHPKASVGSQPPSPSAPPAYSGHA